LSYNEALSVLLGETDSGFWDHRIVEAFTDILRDLEVRRPNGTAAPYEY
jgi:hypothetical protein